MLFPLWLENIVVTASSGLPEFSWAGSLAETAH
jgi:hypothetical protein